MASQKLTRQEFERLLNAETASTKRSGMELGPSFLHLLANAGRQLLSKLLTEHHYEPGDFIFKEGEIGDTIYIIWSGRVAVVKGDFKNPTILGYRGVGEIIGEMALLEDRPRSASVVALESSRTLRIKREDFEQWLSENPSLGLGILGTLSARLREADDARKSSSRDKIQLSQQVTNLQTEKEQLLELERIRQNTIDFIVHDLRHPISSLFGAINILEMVLPEDILQANKQLIDIANANCNLLQLMAASLLDVARMEGGVSELSLVSVDLSQLIEDAIRGSSVFTTLEDITVKSIIPDNLPLIKADKDRVYRILSNLLNNAIKYTPSKGQITIATELKDDHLRISVNDTGPGIVPEDRQRIFDRYAQVTGTKARSGGFGLGLAFCRIAVEAHGGQIWVEAGDNGFGSKFIFTLPLSIDSPNGSNHRVENQSLPQKHNPELADAAIPDSD